MTQLFIRVEREDKTLVVDKSWGYPTRDKKKIQHEHNCIKIVGTSSMFTRITFARSIEEE